MKRSTAVRHLKEMGTEATEQLRLRGTAIGWSLEELWAAGDFVSDAATVDDGVILLRLAVPAVELPWLALHPKGEWVGEVLRLGKRPLSWWYRSIEDPPWTIEHRRVVRFWSAAAGLDEVTVERLGAGALAGVEVVAPSQSEFPTQVQRDLERSHDHLRKVVDGYWEREWRQQHRPPEDHLWRAAAALCAIEKAGEIGLR
jgi:hypothetical protein